MTLHSPTIGHLLLLAVPQMAPGAYDRYFMRPLSIRRNINNEKIDEAMRSIAVIFNPAVKFSAVSSAIKENSIVTLRYCRGLRERLNCLQVFLILRNLSFNSNIKTSFPSQA